MIILCPICNNKIHSSQYTLSKGGNYCLCPYCSKVFLIINDSSNLTIKKLNKGDLK